MTLGFTKAEEEDVWYQSTRWSIKVAPEGKGKKKMVPVSFSKAEGEHEDSAHWPLILESILSGPCPVL